MALTFTREASTQVVSQVKGVLDRKTLAHPHLLELENRIFCPNRNNSGAVFKEVAVVLEEADPKLSN